MITQNLQQIGWQPFFQQQMSLDEWDSCVPARIIDYQRSVFTVLAEDGHRTLQITPNMPVMTVGDWVFLDNHGGFLRRLERRSLFQRKAAGSKIATQLIAANIDTVFVVSSMNQDFSLNRLERYIALSKESGVEPVIVLTRLDLCDQPHEYIHAAQSLGPLLMVLAVNALDSVSGGLLLPWCGPGKTVTLIGSSGVGKSTLVNTLLGSHAQVTASIRRGDDEGRHTTTSRSMHLLDGGGWLVDTPGMRELQLTACEEGLESAFSDISGLASSCRFHDCQHSGEPGCAVVAALERGEIGARRLNSYHKLMREQALNAESLAEKHSRDRKLGKIYRQTLAFKDRHR